MSARAHVLTISELFPDPSRPAFGIFVAKQVEALQSSTEQVVLVPSRIFPPTRIFRGWNGLPARLSDWVRRMTHLPNRMDAYGAKVVYARYTSPPRQLGHGSWGFFAYHWLRRTLRALQREHNFDLIHAHYAVPSGVVALLARRWMRVPVVLSVHGMDLTFTAKQDPLSRAVVRWVFRRVDSILANSSWVADQIVALGADRSKVQVVHLGASPPPSIRVSARAEAAPMRVLSVGNLEPKKGQAQVLQALAQLRRSGYPFRYTIVGGGPEEERLKRMTAELSLEDSVCFTGAKPHAEVWAYYADSDLFVMPSWDEGFGVVYIEALSLGIPVIGSEGQGVGDLNRFGDCVELVEPRDVDALAAALRRFFDDPNPARQRAETGRSVVREQYSWARNAEQTFEVYSRLLARRAS